MAKLAAEHTCPICLSHHVERTRRHGVPDHLARLLRWRVYACRDCRARFYDLRSTASGFDGNGLAWQMNDPENGNGRWSRRIR